MMSWTRSFSRKSRLPDTSAECGDTTVPWNPVPEKYREYVKAAALLILLLVALNARTILVAVTGVSVPMAVVDGYSMCPSLREGDLVIGVKPSHIEPGDVIIYRSRTGDKLIIHRVIRVVTVNGKHYYVTKGDNNPAPDYMEFAGNLGVPEDRVEAKVLRVNGAVVKIPYIGYLSLWYHGSR